MLKLWYHLTTRKSLNSEFWGREYLPTATSTSENETKTAQSILFTQTEPAIHRNRDLNMYYICLAELNLTSTHILSTSFLCKMCGCTLYDSPTCGHSWLSMSQPCGFLSDLLSCPSRQTYQTLIAPPFACPQCNGGFADRETIEMVQGPWGCNQLIRSHLGGNHAIPGSWGNAALPMNNWGAGLGLGMGMNTSMSSISSSRARVPVNGYGYDHRLTGPYGSRPAICSGLSSFGNGMIIDDGYLDDYDYDFDYGFGYDGRRRRKHKSSSRYVYRHSSKPATNCAVM